MERVHKQDFDLLFHVSIKWNRNWILISDKYAVRRLVDCGHFVQLYKLYYNYKSIKTADLLEICESAE